jgi:hypothetical protein
LAGEVMEKDIPAASFVRVGKTTTEGEWVAVIDQVACDSNGAFEP